jgi:hypothetical protein
MRSPDRKSHDRAYDSYQALAGQAEKMTFIGRCGTCIM